MIEISLLKKNIILDGEMYTDDINFESIVGLVHKGHKSDEEISNSIKYTITYLTAFTHPYFLSSVTPYYN